MLRKIIYIIVTSLLIVSLGGCRRLSDWNQQSDMVVAQVGELKLYLEQTKVATHGASGADSLALLEAYVNKWVATNLKIQAAETTLAKGDIDDIDRMVAEYRSSLLARKVERNYVDSRIDTIFTEAQIRDYYSSHASEFQLANTIVKGRIVEVPTTYRLLTKFMTMFGANDDTEWRDVCSKSSFDVKEFVEWIDFDVFLSNLPITRNSSHVNLLKKGVVQQVRYDNELCYLFVVTDFKTVGEVAPLERVAESVKRILFTKRQNELIRAFDDTIYVSAMSQEFVKINLKTSHQPDAVYKEDTTKVDTSIEDSIDVKHEVSTPVAKEIKEEVKIETIVTKPETPKPSSGTAPQNANRESSSPSPKEKQVPQNSGANGSGGVKQSSDKGSSDKRRGSSEPTQKELPNLNQGLRYSGSQISSTTQVEKASAGDDE